MSTELRKTCRATGQVGVLVSTVESLVWLATTMRNIRDYDLMSGSLGHLFLIFLIVSALGLPLGFIVFWASAQEHRGRLVVVFSGALALCHLLKLGLIQWMAGGLAFSSFAGIANLFVSALLLVGPLALVVHSFRGGLVGIEEGSVLSARSPWIYAFVLPLLGFESLCAWLLWDTVAPELSVATIVVVGALYALTRRLGPVPGVASWLSAMTLLGLLAVPSYLLELWAAATGSSGLPVQYQVREVVSCVAVLTGILVLVALSARRTRGRSQHRPALSSRIRQPAATGRPSPAAQQW